MSEFMASPSFSNDLEKEREFYVKDIPSSLKDWDLFRIFRRYGLVNSIRIPPNQTMSDKKYGFVSMIGFDSADNVRKSLVKGRLVVDDKLTLIINDTRGGAEKDNKPLKQAGFAKGKSPLGAAPKAMPLNRNRTFEKKAPVYVVPTLYSPDFPLNETHKVIMVPSPFPPSAEEGFVFHVYRHDHQIPKEYDALQLKMNEYCGKNKPLASITNGPEIKVGDPVIYGKDAVAYRGIRTGANEIYLMDLDGGKRVEFNDTQVWLMESEFCSPPTLVASCILANVKWLTGSDKNFKRYRDVLINWSTKEDGLSITIKGYSGAHNVVEVFGTAGGLRESLVRQGAVSAVEPQSNVYTRDELNSFKEKAISLPECIEKNGAIEKILVSKISDMGV